MNIKDYRKRIFLCLFLFLFAFPLFGEVVWKRKVLGIYDSFGEKEAYAINKIQVHVQAILNYYGYYAEFLDLRTEPYPSVEKMEEYDLIISWFENENIPKPDEYLLWLEKIKTPDKNLVIFDYTGMEQDGITKDPLPDGMKTRLLALVDLDYRSNSRPPNEKVQIYNKDSEMMDFEIRLEEPPGEFEWNSPKNDKVKTWLTLTHEDIPHARSSIVTTSPAGGYAKIGYVTWDEEPLLERARWRLNPFLYFKEILQTSHIPVPDPTTLNGKRIFYTHIDGDAFNNMSLISPGRLASEMIEELIIKAYPQMPIGVSYIIAEITPEMNGKPLHIEIARRILALDNVEIASHTYTHPYQWRGDDRTSAFSKTPFDLEHEMRDSIDYINNTLAPPNKKLVTFYWTGDTRPPERAFEILEEMGVQNLNGGDSQYDNHYDSYTSVSPYVRPMGKHWQIHTSNSNEILYTKSWREDFNGMENLIQTFERTDTPYRIAATNVYYHFYTGDRTASVEAIKKVYDYVIAKDYALIYPSQYIDIVKGFLSTRVVIMEKGLYRIENRGKLNTLRLDEGSVDQEKSKGVLRVDKHNKSLYIALDPNEKNPIIKVN